MSKKETGMITPNGVVLERHESETVVFLTEMGYDIELIRKSDIKGIHRPDIKMLGIEWEMKSPKGKGKWLIKNTIQDALHQSENIIIDLRRVRLPQEKCLFEIKKQMRLSKRIRRLWVITKYGRLLDFQK